jgi:hypothetical protein
MGAAGVPRDEFPVAGTDESHLRRDMRPDEPASALHDRPTAGANPPNSQRREDRYDELAGEARVVRQEPIPPAVAPDDGDAPARRRGRTSLVGGQPRFTKGGRW